MVIREEIAQKTIPLTELLFSAKFITIYLMITFQLIYAQYFIQIYKELGKDYIPNDSTLSQIGATGYICSSVARILTGLICDCVESPSRINNLVICAFLLQIFTLPLTLQDEKAYAVSVCIALAAEGATVTMLAVMIIKQFGAVRGAQLYSYGVSALTCAMLFTNVLHYSVGYY